MPNFSPDQLETLSQFFSDLAAEVGQRRLDYLKAGAELSDPKIVSLLASQFSLLKTGSNFAVEAAGVTLSDADQAVNAITVATRAADAALNNLKNIDQAVTIGSDAVLLATAIFTGDMSQIANAGKTLFDAATAKPAEDSKA